MPDEPVILRLNLIQAVKLYERRCFSPAVGPAFGFWFCRTPTARQPTIGRSAFTWKRGERRASNPTRT
jgi:hypothetical protein